MRRIFGKGRYANVTATIALVLAMGGTSYAAAALQHNSVGSWQIKPYSIKSYDLAGGSVTSAKVKNYSLQTQDFAAGVLQAGPAGPAGPSGPAGAFARVDAGGTLNAGSPAQNQGIAQSDTWSTGPGVYCFGPSTFTPRSAVVAVEDDATAGKFAASVAVKDSQAPFGNCPGATVRVTLRDISAPGAPAAAHGFTVWMQK
jgi:hypothetical protein